MTGPRIEALADGRERVAFVWDGPGDAVLLDSLPWDALDDRTLRPGAELSIELPAGHEMVYGFHRGALPPFDPERAQEWLASIEQNTFADPRNPDHWPETEVPAVAARLAALPAAHPRPRSILHPCHVDWAVPTGTWRTLQLSSDALDDERTIHVYAPRTPPRRVIIAFDGQDWQTQFLVSDVVDAAGADTAAILVAHPDRNTELLPNDPFRHVVVDELLPWARSAFEQLEEITVTGFSYGAVMAVWIALQHPDAFAHVVAASGTYPDFATMNAGQTRFTLTAGDLDPDARSSATALAPKLEAEFLAVPGGHDHSTWHHALRGSFTSKHP
ncbi:MAG: alpha/beta hydrolase-fold protein [Microbacterium sp.]